MACTTWMNSGILWCAYEKALRIGTVRAGIVFSSVSHRLRQLFLEIEEKLTDAG